MKLQLPQQFLIATLVALGQQVSARAHGGETDGATDSSRWGLGLAVMSERKPYRDFDKKTEALPFITFENRWVRVFGPGVELKLGNAGPVSFGLTASFAMDGYKASDSSFLDGMAKRKNSAWIGAKAGLRVELGQLSAEWSGDASGNSKGQKFKLGVERRFTSGDIGLTPRLAATWMDSKFVDYYYGVTAAEVRAGRAAYRADSTTHVEVGFRLDHRLAPQHTVFADVGAMALGWEIKNSPLVDRSTLTELRLGYLYRF